MSILRVCEAFAALVQTIAFAVHLQDVDVASEPVQQCTRETFGAEGFRPFFVGQIAGDNVEPRS